MPEDVATSMPGRPSPCTLCTSPRRSRSCKPARTPAAPSAGGSASTTPPAPSAPPTPSASRAATAPVEQEARAAGALQVGLPAQVARDSGAGGGDVRRDETRGEEVVPVARVRVAEERPQQKSRRRATEEQTHASTPAGRGARPDTAHEKLHEEHGEGEQGDGVEAQRARRAVTCGRARRGGGGGLPRRAGSRRPRYSRGAGSGRWRCGGRSPRHARRGRGRAGWAGLARAPPPCSGRAARGPSLARAGSLGTRADS
eukprot:scaffold53253_cov65-Phaeocystis_antarctica.AAC.4